MCLKSFNDATCVYYPAPHLFLIKCINAIDH